MTIHKSTDDLTLKLNHIQHIGIPVANIKVSEAFGENSVFKM
jgi:hypothetical protein